MSLLEALLWLTLNVYHEARSEPQIGQMAVAHVTMNRAVERSLSVKDVVQQPHQFSWTFQKKSYIPDDPQAFIECLESVYLAMKTKDMTSGATYYHRYDIAPFWTSSYTFVDQYGAHKFYKE